MFDNLKTCVFGGYNKMETLKYIDNLNNEIYMLETAIENKTFVDGYNLQKETEQSIKEGETVQGKIKITLG